MMKRTIGLAIMGAFALACPTSVRSAPSAEKTDAVRALKIALAHVKAKGLRYLPDRCTINLVKRRDWVVEFKHHPINGHQLLGSQHEVRVDDGGKVTFTASR